MNCNDVICTCGKGQYLFPDELKWWDGQPYCPDCN